MDRSFVRNTDGNFIVNGITVSKSVFLALEPSYSEIENLDYLRYTKSKRTVNANGKHYYIDGVWDDGERYMNRADDYVLAMALIEKERGETEDEIRNLIDAANTPRGKRRSEYPPIEDLVIALWENLIEKKSKKDSGVEQIQKLRKAVKAKYPTENTDNAFNTDEEETN